MAAQHNKQHTAIIGGGWAGMAAAVAAAQAGQHVTVLEAARTLGGRARAVEEHHPAPGQPSLRLDNGQHILIGAYSACLQLMRLVGVDVDSALLRRPLALSFPDGTGLALPNLPAPWDALLGILRTRGWSLPDKLGLLRTATQWQLSGFACAPGQTVAQLCTGLTPRLQAEFIEPLCVSALNTPAQAACGQVFLRVLKDAMFGQRGGSNLLLPQVDLSALFPDAAARWLRERGHTIQTGQRVQHLRARPGAQTGWQLEAGEQKLSAHHLIIATPAHEAARLLIEAARSLDSAAAAALQAWAVGALALHHEAITTVYAQADASTRLAAPMLALRADAHQPAQFVFDRGQLGGPAGLLAFVISASQGGRDALQQRVVHQAKQQLQLTVRPLQTITEKRATFACTPNLPRPAMQPLADPSLRLCGDYIAGPYPATLEGAVRSGWAAGHGA